MDFLKNDQISRCCLEKFECYEKVTNLHKPPKNQNVDSLQSSETLEFFFQTASFYRQNCQIKKTGAQVELEPQNKLQ